MQLSDVMKVIGDDSLDEFPWGCVVIQTINLFVADAYRLTPASTGIDVNRALDSLEPSIKGLVLAANLDAQSCRITAPVGGGMVLEFDDEQDEARTSDTHVGKPWTNPIFLIAASLVAVILVASVVMLSTLSTHQDVDWGELLLQVLKVVGMGVL